MKTGICRTLAAALLFGLAACSGGDTTGEDAGGGTPDAGRPDAGGGEPDGGQTLSECDQPANLDRKQQLLDAQPALGTRSRQVLTATVTFPSRVADSAVLCPVSLKFKDSNGNGTVEPYEDWTLATPQRVADLVGRMTPAQKLGLMAHATLTDVPTSSSQAVSAATEATLAGSIRFGRTAANSASVGQRASWANNLQEKCEAGAHGIPFVLSLEPAHAIGPGRSKAKGFSHWPAEPGLAASGDLSLIEGFGRMAAADYRAIGVRMALSPSADLATDPRWSLGQFTFGEDSATVAKMVAAYIKGFQGTSLGRESVACVVKHFPGAGPAKGGLDARLSKGRYVAYPGNSLDAHLAPFEKAFEAGVAAVMPGYGVLQTGAWSGLGGIIDGATLEQVGASYNATLLTGVLREHYGFSGLVLSPWGVLEDAGVSPLGAPWGVEAMTRAGRVAKAVNAGVDQFGGLNDTAALAAARAAGEITDAQIDAAAARALAIPFALGLFEDPYVDPAKAAPTTGADATYQASLKAMNAGIVLVQNADKPAGWLDGEGDGTQSGDKGNAGNGSGKVLPAPPGAPYIAAGCSYFVMGNFDLGYIQSVSTGYGNLTNDATAINGVVVTTDAERIARSDYVFIRVSPPAVKDPDSGALNLPTDSLEYASTDPALLANLAAARAAIDAMPGSKCQIIVAVDGGRPSVVSEIQSHGVSGLYLHWNGVETSIVDDKSFLDVAFGLAPSGGKLPFGLPLSNAAVGAATQQEDVAGDGQHPTYGTGFGLSITTY